MRWFFPLSSAMRRQRRGRGGRQSGYRCLEPTTRELRVRVRTDHRVIPLLADHGHLLAPLGSILGRCCCTPEHLGSLGATGYRRIFFSGSPRLSPRRRRLNSHATHERVLAHLFFFFHFPLYTLHLSPTSFLLLLTLVESNLLSDARLHSIRRLSSVLSPIEFPRINLFGIVLFRTRSTL